ncbi:MAG TPA: Hsp20/alpha crystallin family protein [Planctomycetota bacterium]|nr:Hsp20/alpha crystallin family protein [Planctomycetota bacterium]
MATKEMARKGAAGASAPAEHEASAFHYVPAVDVAETADEVLVHCDLPGADPERIDVRFENGTLSIHAPVAPRRNGQGSWILREYDVADYRRSFAVGHDVDANGIQAEYADGVLTLRLPKVAEAKPRKIQVRTG